MTNIKLISEYTKLHQSMYSIIEPQEYKNSELALLNKQLIKELSLSETFLSSEAGLEFLAGATDAFGTQYAQAYAGHQYGHFTILGDGRAKLLGEYKHNDSLIDLQLKGSGRTPYSRTGDGKATLYSMLREYLISEAIHSLHIPTTRSLAVIKTNELIQRENLEPGGILCRTASSHIRVGTFEYAKATGGVERVKELADYTINRHYKELNNTSNKYQKFLGMVVKRQAELIAKWQSVGFAHGVMNTDNMTLSGETIDYGPCAFLDEYIPNKSFSSIDRNNRYAYINQPYIGSWNLARFAETVLELLSVDQKEAVEIANIELHNYQEHFKKTWYNLMANKIGIIDPLEEEKLLIDELLFTMEKHKADFTNTFRLLTLNDFDQLPFFRTKEWTLWFQKWTRQLGTRTLNVEDRTKLMKQSNPNIIPRNLLVEEALIKASKEDDYTLFNELLSKLRAPYNYNVLHEEKFIQPIKVDKEYITYCGT